MATTTEKTAKSANNTTEKTAKSVKSTAEKAEKKEKMYTESELSDIVQRAIAEALKNRAQDNKIVVNKEEMVTVYFFGVVAPGSSVQFGTIGVIPRAGTPLDISKKDFFKGMNLSVSRLLETRTVVVADGLTDEERKRYGLDYADGEVLTQDEFYNIVNYDTDELVERYKKLCEEHKKVVVDLFADDLFEKNGTKATLEKIKALRKASKKDAPHVVPLLNYMLDRLGKNAAEDEE
ncbi:MAG: hypothetical protein J6S14_13655 [Clostridia bacterium]|nr:hypothetical protein [Clostridia bacterium]